MVTPTVTDTRTRLIRVFTFLGGIYFFLYFVLPESAVTDLGMKAHHEQISNGFIVVGVMALGLGLYNIVRAHGARCVFQRPGWLNSLALLVGLCAMIGATSAQWIESMRNTAQIRAAQVLGEFATRIVEDATTPPQGRAVPPWGIGSTLWCDTATNDSLSLKSTQVSLSCRDRTLLRAFWWERLGSDSPLYEVSSERFSNLNGLQCRTTTRGSS